MKDIDFAQQRIEYLREEIRKHDLLYDQHRPIITDTDYDNLYAELVELENAFPQLCDPNSPTQKIVSEVVKGLVKVHHAVPMLSQDKINTVEGIIIFAKKREGLIIAEEKLDGLTIVLKYEDGTLVDAVTRGNGAYGERVLHTIKTIKTLPKHISYKKRLIVRAEAIIPISEFVRVNTNGEYSNPRNLASGTVRQLDSSVAAERGLDLMVFDLVQAEGETFKNDLQMLDFLKQFYFKIVPYSVFNTSDADITNLVHYCQDYAEKRKKLDYLIDGLVLKYSDLAIREELGYHSKAARWSVGYKFASLDAITTLIEVIWQVGRTGQITPVARFNTVEIDGVNISRATLHNWQNIIDKDIRLGDQIVVARGNDVIPQVVQSLKNKRVGNEIRLAVPKACPQCGAPTKRVGPVLYCTGTDCLPQQVEKIKHFVKRGAMDIEGLGASTVETLVDEGLVSSVIDLYILQNNIYKIIKLEGYGTAKVNNILNAVEESKKRPLSRLIFGLSIPNVGENTAKILARHFKNMSALMSAKREDLESLADIGGITAESVLAFFADTNNVQMIEELQSLGLNMEEPQDSIGDSLKGQVFVITGTLSKDRGHFKKLIESLGGKVSSGVSAKTNYLLMGDGADGTSKHKEALKLGVKIIGEEEFLKMANL